MTTGPARPVALPVQLVEVDRSHRAVLQHLGQLYRHDLSESRAHLPNADGTFNNRTLDQFLTGADPEHRAWLVQVPAGLGGFVMTDVGEDGVRSVADFFVVRALRRSGTGREVARQLLEMFPGRWRIGFQRYNPGVEAFWTAVATEAVGDTWELRDEDPVEGRPPDTFLTFTTTTTTG
ncbi:hypothetical protein GCM10027446_21080 [Angustibacter peucedani]